MHRHSKYLFGRNKKEVGYVCECFHTQFSHTKMNRFYICLPYCHVVTFSHHIMGDAFDQTENYSRVISSNNLSFNLIWLNEVSMTFKRMQPTTLPSPSHSPPHSGNSDSLNMYRVNSRSTVCRLKVERREKSLKIYFRDFPRLFFPKLIIWKYLWVFWCPHGLLLSSFIALWAISGRYSFVADVLICRRKKISKALRNAK